MQTKINEPLSISEKNSLEKRYTPIIYTDERQFAFVHKTNYMPNNNEIKSIYRAGGTYKNQGNIYGIKFIFETPISDDSIHFSINSEAMEQDNKYGYNNRKYAVIIPGNIDEFNNISCFHSNNVEFIGIKNISMAYLLCPSEEYEICKRNNPLVKIIPYEGFSVDGFCDLLLYKLGYNVEKLDLSNTGFEWYYNDSKRTEKVISKYGFKFEPEGMEMFYRKRFSQQIMRAKSFYSKLIEIAISNGINLFEILLDLNEINLDNKINISNRKKYLMNFELPENLLDEEINNFLNNFLNKDAQLETRIFIGEMLNCNIDIIRNDFNKIKSEKKI